MTKWTAEDVPDQSGRVALVTGANSGLGLETALALARRGAKVLMASRNEAKLKDAVAQIHERAVPGDEQGAPAPDLDPIVLDLASLASIRQAADEVLAKHDRIDLLILNAGVMAVPEGTTEDGFERQFGTNHLGHFALTGLVLPAMLAVDDSRVVVVTSNARMVGRIDFSDLHSRRHYGAWRAYSQSKLANLIFAETLDRRLRAAGALTIAVAAHPGYAATNLQAGSNWLQTAYLKVGNTLWAQSATAGAWPQLYAATMPGVSGGALYGPDQLFGLRGHPRLYSVESRALNPETGARLWEVSEQETGVSYNYLSHGGQAA
jgi:NAD(P)-dependent dehydrogenase (short-subunit alcohol dehydrogenase family)